MKAPSAAIVAKLDWEEKWFVPKFSFFSCSYLGEHYHQPCLRRWGRNLRHNVFISRGQGIVCYQVHRENEVMGKYLAQKISRSRRFLTALCQEVRERTDALHRLIRRPFNEFFYRGNFARLEQDFEDYLPVFIAASRAANYLTAKTARYAMHPLTEIRAYSESLYSDIDDFFQQLLRHVARRERRNPRLILKMFSDEWNAYLQTGRLPTDRELARRTEGTALYFSAGQRSFWLRRNVAVFERLVAARHKLSAGEVAGQCACPGLARGRVRIIYDPMRARTFRSGDILVTSMTRPEFLPLMKKAGAIVTDAGGVLSHAAIVSREMKKPCVIGTHVATKVLKDGDMVEVDAKRGIVRMIKRA